MTGRGPENHQHRETFTVRRCFSENRFRHVKNIKPVLDAIPIDSPDIPIRKEEDRNVKKIIMNLLR
jgi:hypothetical protein